MMWKTFSIFSTNKYKIMIKLIKNIFKKKSEPRFVKCLNNRSWLDRQVDDALYKRNTLAGRLGSSNDLPIVEKEDWLYY